MACHSSGWVHRSRKLGDLTCLRVMHRPRWLPGGFALNFITANSNNVTGDIQGPMPNHQDDQLAELSALGRCENLHTAFYCLCKKVNSWLCWYADKKEAFTDWCTACCPLSPCPYIIVVYCLDIWTNSILMLLQSILTQHNLGVKVKNKCQILILFHSLMFFLIICQPNLRLNTCNLFEKTQLFKLIQRHHKTWGETARSKNGGMNA